MATLYRNFPGRRELLEALYADEVDGICAAAGRVRGASAGDRFIAWLDQVYAFFKSKRQVAAELLKDSDRHDAFSDGRDRVLAAGQPLLADAQRHGEIRTDLTVEQILDLIHALTTIDADEQYLAPIREATVAGLRSGSVTLN